jgi:hypothetical protein
MKADSTTTIEQIASDPSKWYGKTVTVQAQKNVRVTMIDRSWLASRVR